MVQGTTEAAEKQVSEKAGERRFVKAIWPRLVDLWIFAVIVWFFFVRVFGSHTVQRLLARWSHRPL